MNKCEGSLENSFILARVQSEEELIKLIEYANVICVVYSIHEQETIERVCLTLNVLGHVVWTFFATLIFVFLKMPKNNKIFFEITPIK